MLWQWGLMLGSILSFLGLAVYQLGRKRGRREGRQHAEVVLPLAMRTKVLQTGQCPVCDTQHINVIQCPKRGD